MNNNININKRSEYVSILTKNSSFKVVREGGTRDITYYKGMVIH